MNSSSSRPRADDFIFGADAEKQATAVRLGGVGIDHVEDLPHPWTVAPVLAIEVPDEIILRNFEPEDGPLNRLTHAAIGYWKLGYSPFPARWRVKDGKVTKAPLFPRSAWAERRPSLAGCGRTAPRVAERFR